MGGNTASKTTVPSASAFDIAWNEVQNALHFVPREPPWSKTNPSLNVPWVQAPVDPVVPAVDHIPPPTHVEKRRRKGGGNHDDDRWHVALSQTSTPWYTGLSLSSPGALLEKLWELTVWVVGGVVWQYADWMDQFRQWDGTWSGLLLHTHLLWRTVVVSFLSLGLLEMVPLLETLGRWLSMFFEFLRYAFRLTGDALGEAWTLLVRVYDDVTGLVGRVRSVF